MNQQLKQVAQFARTNQKASIESQSLERTELLSSLFDSTFEQSALGMALIDAGANLIRVNRKLTELSGYSFEKLSDDYFRSLTGNEQDNHPNQVYRLLNVDETHAAKSKVFAFHRPDGTEIHLLTTLTCVLDQQGELSFYIKSIEDVTALRYSEMQIRRMVKEFDNFVYRAFHDLQGPLSSIEGVCNVMKLSLDNAEAIQYADMIGKVSVKMKRALAGMLEAAKINDLERKEVGINFENLVANLLVDLDKMPDFKDVDLRYRIQSDIQYAADPTYLNIIIKHLLENAIVFRDTRKDKSTVDLEIAQDAQGGVCIRVTDNGIGITNEDQKEVFQMFCRKSMLSRGAGIGLYLVKQSVEKLDGHIELHSKINEGTAVDIFL